MKCTSRRIASSSSFRIRRRGCRSGIASKTSAKSLTRSKIIPISLIHAAGKLEDPLCRHLKRDPGRLFTGPSTQYIHPWS